MRRRYAAILRSKPVSIASARKWRISTYSAGMVASASSSKTKCPSACCRLTSADAAALIDASSLPPLPARSRLRAAAPTWAVAIFVLPRLHGPGTVHHSNGSPKLRPGRDVGGAVAGTNRALDCGRQAGRGPVARQDQITPSRAGARSLRILAWQRREGRTALLDDLPSRQLAVEAGECRYLTPNGLRQRFACGFIEAVGGADGHRKAIVKCKQPFRRCVNDAEHRWQPRWRRDGEVGVENGVELPGRRQLRHQRRRHPGRHREDHPVVVGKLDDILAEVEGTDPVGREIEPVQLMIK